MLGPPRTNFSMSAPPRRPPQGGRPPWHHLPVFSFCEAVFFSLALSTVVGLVAFTIGRDQPLNQRVTGTAVAIPIEN